ncbi:hypothetical protein Tco_1112590 [Tanacetum coccineum]|uniref:Uncharacterized protein n=1 Tax=Tanacetum coccineum TaxID=301880 RepID=A0ABQ5IS45_9ASTR
MTTDAQLQALIDQGVAAALAERDASRSRDGDNSHGFQRTSEEASAYSRESLTLILEVPAYKISKAPEGVVWPDPMVRKDGNLFSLSATGITNSGKYASCTLQWSALTWAKSKAESEYWNLQVGEEAKVGKVFRVSSDMILAVLSIKASSMPRAIEFATELMEQKDAHCS